MDVKQAVREAKNYVSDLLDDEGIQDLGLEEIEFDESDQTWNVTLGFSRRWNYVRNALTPIAGERALRRSYRLVKVRDSDGQVTSVKMRELVD